MMTKNTSFIGEHLGDFVESQVKEGCRSSGSDVVRAELRLHDEKDAKPSILCAALIEGEQSGPSMPFDFEAFIAGKRASWSPAFVIAQ
jgi:antitoxin ParD1/3/4